MKAESNVNDSCRNRAGREFFIFSFLLTILECIVFLQIGEIFSYTHKHSIRYRCVAKGMHSMRVACQYERVRTCLNSLVLLLSFSFV